MLFASLLLSMQKACHEPIALGVVLAQQPTGQECAAFLRSVEFCHTGKDRVSETVCADVARCPPVHRPRDPRWTPAVLPQNS